MIVLMATSVASVAGEMTVPAPAVRGSPSAPFVIDMFMDFACIFCKIEPAMLETDILPAFANQVRFRFRHLPLPKHEWARYAADASAFVNEQEDKTAFWQVHDKLFAVQDESAGLLIDMRSFDCIVVETRSVNESRTATV